jgi:branched-chain amino acid transport system substrate-binding protein
MEMSKLLIKIFCIVGILFSTNVIYAQETIKIGAPLALTGGLADEGKKQQIAYDMWLKKVNAAGELLSI